MPDIINVNQQKLYYKLKIFFRNKKIIRGKASSPRFFNGIYVQFASF